MSAPRLSKQCGATDLIDMNAHQQIWAAPRVAMVSS
jgi:hypothetical protein